MSKPYIKQFEVDMSYLSKEEKELLDRLVEAAKLTAKIYVAQLQAGFYPEGVTKKELEKAAIKDSNILSPYTIVERNATGKLVAIPYHKKFKELLLPVAQKLREAAQISVLPADFRKTLLIQADALLSGDYRKAQIAWIKIKPYKIDITIGPIERVEDNIFFVKRSYQAWVGVMDQDRTEMISILKETVFSARRQVLSSESVDFIKKTQLRADRIVIFSGMIAKYNYTATTLPNEIELLEKYGSESWIFLHSVRDNFISCQEPIFNIIFAPFFKSSFSKESLQRGYFLLVAMHEITRIVVRYRFAVERLKEYWPVFNEATVEALAVKLCGILLLKDAISQKEMESVLVIFLTRLFDGYAESPEENSGFKPIVLGNAIMMNSLIESGALKVTKDGISWPNFTKMYIAVSELADNMEKILAEGTYRDARSFADRHSSMTAFKNFAPSLKALHKL